MSRSDSFMGLSDKAREFVRNMRKESYSYQSGYFESVDLYKYTDAFGKVFYEVNQRTEYHGGPIMYNTLAYDQYGEDKLTELSWTLDEISATSGISREFLLEDEELEAWYNS